MFPSITIPKNIRNRLRNYTFYPSEVSPIKYLNNYLFDKILAFPPSSKGHNCRCHLNLRLSIINFTSFLFLFDSRLYCIMILGNLCLGYVWLHVRMSRLKKTMLPSISKAMIELFLKIIIGRYGY